MTNTIIHIGLHKTGTTYLQNNIFPSIADANLIIGNQYIRNLFHVKKSQKLIISDESLAGSLWRGKYLDEFYKLADNYDLYFNEPKIIFGIREHKDFILSVYKQYLHEKGSNNINYLFNESDTGILKRNELMLTNKIEFLKKRYKNVFIYSQNSLLKRTDDFLKSLAEFLDVPPIIPNETNHAKRSNVGVSSKFQIHTLRFTNKINYRLEKLHPRLGFYNNFFSNFNITPRNICQNYLRIIPSKKYTFTESLNNYIEMTYKGDWEKAKQHISY